MKTNFRAIIISLAGASAVLFLGAAHSRAQDGPSPGNFDPEQMRQRRMERMREQFEVKDDAEWKAIAERINKVMEARRATGGMGGPGGPFGGPSGGPPPARPDNSRPQGGDEAHRGAAGPGGPPPGMTGGPGGFGREPDPELEALRKAIDTKAAGTELKAKLAELRAARAKKEAALAKTQDDLRQILSVRQEAIAVAAGLLK